jgi:hypothetical protein
MTRLSTVLSRPSGRGKQSYKTWGFSPKEALKEMITLPVSKYEFAISAAGGQAGLKPLEIILYTSTMS